MTDSQNLYQAVHSTSLVEDSWLVPDVASLQQALEDGVISELRQVSSGDMLANCLTKRGAGAERLLEILRTGTYSM